MASDPNAGSRTGTNSETDSAPRRGRFVRRLAQAFGLATSAAVAVGAIALGTLTIHERAAARQPVEPPPVATVQTTIAKIEPELVRVERYVGRIEPRRTSRLAFERAGTLTEMLSDEGDIIEQGDVIARLETRLLRARKAELEARRTALEAQAELARLTAQRKQKLNERGWATGQAHDDARLEVARLRASIKEVDAALLSVEIDLDKSILKAPFSGRVAARMLDEGTIVAAGVPVLDLIEAGHPQIRVGLPQHQASVLRKDRDYRVSIGERMVSARFSALRPDIDPATRSIIAVFDLPETENYLYGATASLVMETRQPQAGAWLPLSALRETTRGLWSVITVKEGKTDFEGVEVLAIDGERAFVRGTFRDGAVVVRDGNHRLSAGTPVKIAEPDRG